MGYEKTEGEEASAGDTMRLLLNMQYAEFTLQVYEYDDYYYDYNYYDDYYYDDYPSASGTGSGTGSGSGSGSRFSSGSGSGAGVEISDTSDPKDIIQKLWEEFLQVANST